MWELVALVGLLFNFTLYGVAMMGTVAGMGPGPTRPWRRLGPRKSRRIGPFSKGERRLARRVLYPLRRVQELSWSRQRWVYWRVRGHPDRRFARSVWTSSALGLLVGVIVGTVVWGCAGRGSALATFWRMPRRYEPTWIPFAQMVPWAVLVFSPLAATCWAAVGAQRMRIREAIDRYVGSRATRCDRCGYPLDEAAAVGHRLRCPECGLGHDLRVRNLPEPPGRLRIGPAVDGPMVISERRGSRLLRVVPELGPLTPMQRSLLIEHALWLEWGGILLGRVVHSAICLAVAAIITAALWPLVDATIGQYHRGGVTGSPTLALLIALVGPCAGVAAWLWLDRRLIRGVVRRAAARLGVRCPGCGYEIGGLAVGPTGLRRCPECGRESYAQGGRPRVVEAEGAG